MNICDSEVRVFFKRIVDAVTMVGININVRETGNSKTASQCLDHDSTIVEYAEPSSAIPPSMVKSANGHKCAVPVMFHNSTDRS